MIQLKSPEEIEQMARTCRLASETLAYLVEKAKPGVTTLELDRAAEDFIRKNNAVPSPKGYRGFPNSICTAVNDVVVHGIPNNTPLKAGDIVTIDVTVFKYGFHGDKAATLIVDDAANGTARRLMDTTERAMYRGIGEVRPDARLGDVGASIQEFVEAKGYSVVRDFCGHGIGRQFHEQPQVLHFGERGTGRVLRPGMVFTVEPMVNEGDYHVDILPDGWTVKTRDGRLSAQFEHTIAVTERGVRILTLASDHENEMWRAERERRGIGD